LACLHFAQQALQATLQGAKLAQDIGIGVSPQPCSALLGFSMNLPGSLARSLDYSLVVEAGIELRLGFL
jgi:hypothetical protein